MDTWMNILSSPFVLIAVAIALVAVVLLILMKRTEERDKALNERLGGVEQTLADQLKRSQALLGEEAGRDREALSSNLRGMGDSVARVMGEMARTQQAQLDAFAGQLRDMARVDEERMSDMRKTVEERLAAYEGRMDRVGDVLDNKLEKNEQRLERMRQTVEHQIKGLQEGNARQIEGLQKSNDLRLEQMQRTVDERLSKTLDKRLGESFQAVSDRLEKVYKELGEMQSLASGVGDLKKVLTGVKSRGLLGEIQLGGLLSQIMDAGQYEQNVAFRGDGERADFAVKLPGREGEPVCYLPIDAKCPHEAYYRLLEAQEAGDSEEVEVLAGEFKKKMIMAAQRVSAQFICPPATTDFAVMFLGTEGMYAEALRQSELVEALQRDCHVMLTGPNTLAALLNSLQMGFRTLEIEQHSQQVWQLLGAVRGEFATFVEALGRTQKRIRQAGESIEDAARKSKAIERRLKGVEKLAPGQRASLLESEDDDAYDADWD